MLSEKRISTWLCHVRRYCGAKPHSSTISSFGKGLSKYFKTGGEDLDSRYFASLVARIISLFRSLNRLKKS